MLKGPKVEENIKNVLLKPKEVKSVYWISQIPKELDKNYVYSSVIEARDVFSSFDTVEVFYSEDGRYIEKNEADLFLNDIEKREEKEAFTDVDITCDFEDRTYYSEENIEILCNLRNSGNVFLEKLNICLDNECFNGDLGVSEEKDFGFTFKAKESVLFLVENDKFIKKENIKFSVIKSPTIYVTDLSPSELNYGIETDVRFFLNSDFEVRNVLIDIDGIGEIKYDLLNGKKLVEFTTRSGKLISGLNLRISYEDSIGKKYNDIKNYPIVVKNVPFYARWLANFF